MSTARPPGRVATTDLPVGARPWKSGLTNLPARLPVLFFWTALVVSVAALLGAFTPWLVLPALFAVLIVTWRFAPTPVPVDRESLLGALAALALVGTWILVNLRFAAEVLLVQRDAGFLTLEGIWLSRNPDPDVPLRTAAGVAEKLDWLTPVSDAFSQDGAVMNAQGAKTFPALLALGGWAGGETGVRTANLVIAAIGLLALYDIARRLTTPRWALLPVVALMVSLPFLYFSRTPFTEPTNLALTFGGLAVLWTAAGQRRGWPYALGGAMIGANALSRIDGAAAVVGLVAGLALVAAGTRTPALRRSRVFGWAVASGAAGLMVLLGYVDLRVNSPDYLIEHAGLYRPLIAMLAVALVGALALLFATGPRRVTDWVARHGRELGWLGAGLVVAISLLLASRPWWWQRHAVEPGSGQEAFVAAIQRDAGVPVDPTRSYDEMSVTWLSWWYGWTAVILGALGAALLVRRATVHRRPELVTLLVTLALPSLLYLVAPSITPDQIWAMRRFLPAAIPGMLLCGAWVLHRIAFVKRPAWPRIVAGLLAATTVVAPILQWGSLVHTVEYSGRAEQVALLCDAVRSGHVVAIRGNDPPLVPTLRILCDADAVELRGNATAAKLAQVKEAWGGGELFVVALSPSIPGWSEDVGATWSVPMSRWPTTLFPQRHPVDYTSGLWLGTVGDDGTVTPVAPAPREP